MSFLIPYHKSALKSSLCQFIILVVRNLSWFHKHCFQLYKICERQHVWKIASWKRQKLKPSMKAHKLKWKTNRTLISRSRTTSNLFDPFFHSNFLSHWACFLCRKIFWVHSFAKRKLNKFWRKRLQVKKFAFSFLFFWEIIRKILEWKKCYYEIAY